MSDNTRRHTDQVLLDAASGFATGLYRIAAGRRRPEWAEAGKRAEEAFAELGVLDLVLEALEIGLPEQC